MVLTNTGVLSQVRNIASIDWTRIAVVDGEGGKPALGVAGAINAVSGNAFIVAGGANFPARMPWEGGQKHYSDMVRVLQKTAGGYVWNETVNVRLPEPVAYCGNTSTPSGIVYAGGENAKGLSRKAYLLKWRASKSNVEIQSLPDLPLALTNLALVSVRNTVYAVGGDQLTTSSASFLKLELDSRQPVWESLAALPVPLANTLVVSQKVRGHTEIFVIGGRAKNPSGISDLYSTVYIYTPSTNTWRKGAPVSDGLRVTNFSAGTGVSLCDNFILLTGGDDGEIFHQIETYISRISGTRDLETKDSLILLKNKLITNHPGFNRDILLYDSLKDSWQKIGVLPFPAQVTTTAAKWGKKILLSNGEIRPGVRTPDVMLGDIKKIKALN